VGKRALVEDPIDEAAERLARFAVRPRLLTFQSPDG
jgi:hypothetical protein